MGHQDLIEKAPDRGSSGLQRSAGRPFRRSTSSISLSTSLASIAEEIDGVEVGTNLSTPSGLSSLGSFCGSLASLDSSILAGSGLSGLTPHSTHPKWGLGESDALYRSLDASTSASRADPKLDHDSNAPLQAAGVPTSVPTALVGTHIQAAASGFPCGSSHFQSGPQQETQPDPFLLQPFATHGLSASATPGDMANPQADFAEPTYMGKPNHALDDYDFHQSAANWILAGTGLSELTPSDLTMLAEEGAALQKPSADSHRASSVSGLSTSEANMPDFDNFGEASSLGAQEQLPQLGHEAQLREPSAVSTSIAQSLADDPRSSASICISSEAPAYGSLPISMGLSETSGTDTACPSPILQPGEPLMYGGTSIPDGWQGSEISEGLPGNVAEAPMASISMPVAYCPRSAE